MTDETMMSPEEMGIEMHRQFGVIADLARKATEDHVLTLVNNAHAPALDAWNVQFAVLCGTVSAAATSLVGFTDPFGIKAVDQFSYIEELSAQMNNVFQQILERKALIAATEEGTKQ